MQYLLLIYTDEKVDAAMSDAAKGELFAGYMSYNEHLQGRDAMVAGDALQPVATATSVRVRDGQTLTTDGPFAETKEQLGGYYLVEADNLDDAIGYAAKIPSAKHGTIEVRPIMVIDMKGA